LRIGTFENMCFANGQASQKRQLVINK